MEQKPTTEILVGIACGETSCKPCRFLIYCVGDPFPLQCDLFHKLLEELPNDAAKRCPTCLLQEKMAKCV